ncbi:MAG: RHS repeat-associated core domain-containing protein [Pirellulaceae bacterium]|nr:RHS repeat-associated core domain-containing protein [Pirellulaceae bacterium]
MSDLAWAYDLVGNRLSQTKFIPGVFNGPDKNEQTLYSYDANDRLKSEMYTGTQTTQEEPQVTTTTNTSQTIYAYNKTQQTSKTKVEGTITTTQTFSYNRQGLMASVITDTSDQTTLKRVDYSYDTGGHRVGTAEYEALVSAPESWTLTATTRYLTDVQNPTGYSQVLQETHYSGGAPSKKIIYTVGHDQISQATYTLDTSGLQSLASNLFFGTDGHGSVRALYDLAGAVATVGTSLPQQFDYDAYGNLLGWNNLQPATTYLYNSESFDFRIGQQYLRARWYDPRTGRFNQLDPLAGNSSDPHSFHKYAYVHGDPVNGVDPSGMFAQVAFIHLRAAYIQAGRSAALGGLQAAGRRLGVTLAKNFAEWYYIDNHINSTIDALAGLAYDISGIQDPALAQWVSRVNTVLGTITAARRVMKAGPLAVVPFFAANPDYRGSRLEKLVGFYSTYKIQQRYSGYVAGGLVVLGSMPLLIAQLNFAATFSSVHNPTLSFRGVTSPLVMVSRMVLGSAIGTSGPHAFYSTVFLPDIIESVRAEIRRDGSPRSVASAIEQLVSGIQAAFPEELGFDDEEEW